MCLAVPLDAVLHLCYHFAKQVITLQERFTIDVGERF